MILQCIYWIGGLVGLSAFLIICERIVRKRYCPTCKMLTANTVFSPWAYFIDVTDTPMKVRREVKVCSRCGHQHVIDQDFQPSSHEEQREAYAARYGESL